MWLDAVILGSKIVFCFALLSVDESIEKLKSYGKGENFLWLDLMKFYNTYFQSGMDKTRM